MRTMILLAYLATFTTSVGSFLGLAVLVAMRIFEMDISFEVQFWLALLIGLALALAFAFRARRRRWPHMLAILVGPIIAGAFYLSFDSQSRVPPPRPVMFQGVDLLVFRGLLAAAGVWFLSGNFGILLQWLNRPSWSSDASGAAPTPAGERWT